jgi:hypothetical protein
MGASSGGYRCRHGLNERARLGGEPYDRVVALLETETHRSPITDMRKLERWRLSVLASAVALEIIAGLEHRRFEIDPCSGTIVFVLAVLAVADQVGLREPRSEQSLRRRLDGVSFD